MEAQVLLNKKFQILIISIIALLTNSFAQGDTMYIKGRHVYTADGEKVILRGVNEMFVWSDEPTGETTLPEIAKTGANCVRLVWTNEGNAEDFTKLMDNCIANKMIAMPECHDATGKWEDLYQCLEMWKNPAIKKSVMKHKKWTLLNIGNEVGDGTVTAVQFKTEYKKAIDSLRLWGYTVPLVIDASNWGQDVDVIIASWKELQEHDPLKNILFSVHSYWETTENYQKVVNASLNDSLPIIIGEGPSITRYPTCEILDYKTGLDLCGKNDIGWLSWSWGMMSNGHCVPDFDHTTDGKFGNWETKDNEIQMVSHPYSLMRTAERPASFYADGVIPATGVAIVVAKSEIKVGEKLELDVIIAPVNATNTEVEVNLVQDGEIAELINNKQILTLASGVVKLEVVHKNTKIKSELEIQVYE